MTGQVTLGAFMPGSFQPPVNYGIQSPAIGRGGPGMAPNSYAKHMNGWPPSWKGQIFSLITPYPYGAASSLRTQPSFPNLWTAFGIPAGSVMKQPSNVPVF